MERERCTHQFFVWHSLTSETVENKGKELPRRTEATKLSEQGTHSLTNWLLSITNLGEYNHSMYPGADTGFQERGSKHYTFARAQNFWTRPQTD